MIAPGSTARGNAETKQKVESKPIVESKNGVEPREKSRKFLILIGAACLLLAGGCTTFLTVPYFRGARTALWTKMTADHADKEEVRATLSLEPFLVNLADTDDIRFVKTTFQLGLADEPDEDVNSGAAIAAIRDSIISLLSSKKAEQILTPQGKDTLRQEIRSRVNSLSPKTKVLEVYIVDFVVQL